MKPSWDDPACPEWANYLARDSDGTWVWFENKPAVDMGSGCWVSDGKSEIDDVLLFYKYTLEERPKND
jgi:hypothetical protein